MKQEIAHIFTSDCGRISVSVDSNMPIGEFHDFLMQIKGLMVERMVKAHQEQIKEAEASKARPPHESEISVEQEEIKLQEGQVQ